jgi:hypothetical protein
MAGEHSESQAHGTGSNGVSDSSADRAAFIAGELGDEPVVGKGAATEHAAKMTTTLMRTTRRRS